MDGKPTPAKPASLSAAQAVDDAADSALALIEARIASAKGELQNAAWIEAEARIVELVQARHKIARQGVEQAIKGMRLLVDAVGKSAANSILSSIASLPWVDVFQLTIAEIADVIPEVSQIHELYQIRAAEAHMHPDQLEISEIFSA